MLEGFVFKMSIIAEKDFGTLIFFRSYSATSIFNWKCIFIKKKQQIFIAWIMLKLKISWQIVFIKEQINIEQIYSIYFKYF